MSGVVVVDASVALKWFLAESPRSSQEADVDAALVVFERIVLGQLQWAQPPHFVAEVAAVLARLKPLAALDDVADLQAVPCKIVQSAAVLARAVQLAVSLEHHVFDTLYHAVALATPGATLVTADRKYFAKAQHLGRIAWLADFQVA